MTRLSRRRFWTVSSSCLVLEADLFAVIYMKLPSSTQSLEYKSWRHSLSLDLYSFFWVEECRGRGLFLWILYRLRGYITLILEKESRRSWITCSDWRLYSQNTTRFDFHLISWDLELNKKTALIHSIKLEHKKIWRKSTWTVKSCSLRSTWQLEKVERVVRTVWNLQ